MRPLFRRALRGFLGVGVLSNLSYLVRIGSQVALARLLTPEIFGEVSFAVASLELLALPGQWATEALVVQERLEDEDVETLFTLRVAWALLYALLVLGLLAVAPGEMYGETARLAVLVLAAGRVVRLVGDVPASVLQKEMRITVLAGIELAGIVAGAAIGIGGAAVGLGALGLIAFYLIQSLVSGFLFLIVAPFSPSIRWDLRSVARIWRAGREILVVEAAGKVDSRLDDWTVGAVVSKQALGLYNMAWKISLLPQQLLMPALNKVVLPLTARLREEGRDRARVRGFVVRNTVRASTLAAAILFATAGDLVGVFLGDGWLGVVPVLRAFAIYAAVVPVFNIQKQFLFGESRPRIYRRAKLWEVGVFIVGVYPAATIGGAVAVVVWLTLCHLFGLTIAWRGFPGGPARWRDVAPGCLAGAVAAVAGWWADVRWLSGLGPELSISLVLGIVLIVWLSVALVSGGSGLRQDLAVLRRSFS